MKTKLTVLMPVYNSEAFLDESITSILNQTYTDFEFVILDDCSTDNSLEIIQNYSKKDSRIKILQNKQNKRHAVCRNILLKSAQTEFIAWMDADDISLLERFEIQLSFLRKNTNIDVVGSHMDCFGHNNNKIRVVLTDYEIKTFLLLSCALANPTTMIRTEKIRKHNILYSKKLTSATDFQFWVNCAPFVTFANIDKVLLQYRVHSKQEGIANIEKQLTSHLTIVKNHLEKFGINQEKEIIKIILDKSNQKPSLVQLQQTKKLIKKILAIKNFYNFSETHSKSILQIFYNTVYNKAGLVGKLLFIKNFGTAIFFTLYLKKVINLIKKLLF